MNYSPRENYRNNNTISFEILGRLGFPFFHVGGAHKSQMFDFLFAPDIPVTGDSVGEGERM